MQTLIFFLAHQKCSRKYARQIKRKPATESNRGFLGIRFLEGEINRKNRSFTNVRENMQSAARLKDQAFNNGQAQACALAGGLGGEVRLKNEAQHFLGDSRAIILHGNGEERFGGFESLCPDHEGVRVWLEGLAAGIFIQNAAVNLDLMGGAGALKGVDGQIEQNLKHVSAIDVGFLSRNKRMNDQFISEAMRMAL